MAPGDVAEIHLKGSEPLENVPRSVEDMGHSIISLESLDGGEDRDQGVHRLLIRKA